MVTLLKGGETKVVESAEQATLVACDRIIAPQLSGVGQWAEVVASGPEKVWKCGLACLEGSRWVVIVVTEEDRKKA